MSSAHPRPYDPRPRPRLAALALGLALAVPPQALAQEPSALAGAQEAPAVAGSADTVWIEAAEAEGVPAVPYPRPLTAGEAVAAWVESDVAVGRPRLEGRPVGDAPLGAVVARFEGSGVFAWPDRPFVWTAPGPGRLVFGVNAYGAHEPEGRARVVLVPLTGGAARAFPPPAIVLDRVAGGILARYADRAGFGLAPSTLRLTVTTNRGVTHHLAPWTDPGARETFLPLPPPSLALPPGVHTLSATVGDWLGNFAPAARIAFDTP